MTRKKSISDILVVDDSALICKTIASILDGEGYRLHTCHSGEEALKLLAHLTPDAILCDIVMPGIDGYEFCRRVKRQRRTRNVPVILLTSRSDPRDKVKGLELGAADYVTKPFDPGELRARLDAQLRIVRLQDELRTRNEMLTQMRQQLEDKVEALSMAYAHVSEEQVKRQKALDLAYKVQLGLLPDSQPRIDGFGFGSRFLPADNIAGDFYDYIQLEGGRWGLAIGDVAGKGLPASLLMVLTKTLLRSEASRGFSPARVLENVNRLIISHYGSSEAVTLFYGILDPANNSFTFSNGGHEFPLVCATGSGECVELTPGGTFLGIFPNARYNEARIQFQDGDLVLFYTDGIFHVRVGETPIGSSEALWGLLARRGGAGAGELLDELLSAAAPRVAGADDVTAIAMRCSRSAARDEIGYIGVHNVDVNLRDIRDFTGLLMKRLRVPEPSAFDFVYGVDEAAANAILHAYERQGTGHVEIFYRYDAARLELQARIVDHGRGLTPEQAERSRSSLADDPLRAGGRGFTLMKSLLDGCDILPTPGGGATVVLTKCLRAAVSGGQ